MQNELPFRLAAAAVLLCLAPIGIYHRRRAASGEPISYREEGYVFAAVLRLCGLCMWISLLAYLLVPESVRWATIPLPDWLRWTGAAIGVACTALMTWTLHTLGHNLTDTVVTRQAATLVTHGPYRWVRHPFYVTAALLIMAMTLLSANGLLLLFGVLTLLLLAIRTPKEEALLIARFGDAYRNYAAGTGRFFPRRPR